MGVNDSKYKADVPKPFNSPSGKIGHHMGRRGRKRLDAEPSLIYPQAEHVIRKFGGAGKLAAVLKELYPDPKDHWHRTSIYRWSYPRSVGGCGGEIPVRAIKQLLKAARYTGIVLTADDLYPNLFAKGLPDIFD